VESGELVPAAALLGQLGTIPKLAELLGRLGVPEGEQSAEQAAAAVEFALEGLYLTRRLAKDTDGGRTIYGA
jgi:magnesium chelatase subunit I